MEPLSYASSTALSQPAALQPQHILIAVLVLGVATNVYRIADVYYHDTRPGGVRIDAFGHTDWFTRGEWPGTAHWGAINALPAGSRVMLVGEARTFYLLAPCDYAVIFNSHPLAEAVRENPEPKAVIAWLRQRGTTHVLVHHGEIMRFLKTYGFYAELTPELFDQLEKAGLKRIGDYAVSEGQVPYATLYEVPRHG